MKKSLGFSLLELLIALGIAAILVGIGGPALRDATLDARRTATLNGLLRAVHVARAEAGRTGIELVFCARQGGAGGCAGSAADWAQGWVVFVNEDRDRPAVADADEPVLLTEGPRDGARITGNRSAFRFLPFNRRSSNGTLVYCDQRGAGSARAFILSFTGRPRLSDRDASGRPVDCRG